MNTSKNLGINIVCLKREIVSFLEYSIGIWLILRDLVHFEKNSFEEIRL